MRCPPCGSACSTTSTALDAAWDLVKDWTVADHEFLRAETPKTGLSTVFRGRSLTEWAREVVEIAHAGLRARKRLDGEGNDETIYLAPLDRAVASGPGAGRRAPGQVAGRVEGLLRPAVPRPRLLRYRRAMLDRCDRVQIAVHDAAKAAQRFGLLLGGEDRAPRPQPPSQRQAHHPRRRRKRVRALRGRRHGTDAGFPGQARRGPDDGRLLHRRPRRHGQALGRAWCPVRPRRRAALSRARDDLRPAHGDFGNHLPAARRAGVESSTRRPTPW